MNDTARLCLVWILRFAAAWAVLLIASQLASLVQFLWALRDVGGSQQWGLGFAKGVSLYGAIALSCLAISEFALGKKRHKPRQGGNDEL